MNRNASGMQQMSPLALVTHGSSQANAAVAAAHQRLLGPGFGQIPGLLPHDVEQRMMEYFKLMQAQNEQARPSSHSPSEAMNALEMSRLALWQMYQNNTSPPVSVNTSPQGMEAQR